MFSTHSMLLANMKEIDNMIENDDNVREELLSGELSDEEISDLLQISDMIVDLRSTVEASLSLFSLEETDLYARDVARMIEKVTRFAEATLIAYARKKISVCGENFSEAF